MSEKQQTATWVFVMLAAMRQRLGLSRADVLRLEKHYRIIAFLMKHYELLHYYANDFVVDNVVNYIAEQGGDISELCRTH